ncbi:hypothetical protein CsSME_00024531 [Camellia sinensis var. sinensis]
MSQKRQQEDSKGRSEGNGSSEKHRKHPSFRRSLSLSLCETNWNIIMFWIMRLWGWEIQYSLEIYPKSAWSPDPRSVLSSLPELFR